MPAARTILNTLAASSAAALAAASALNFSSRAYKQ
jgi:hypothetical protein